MNMMGSANWSGLIDALCLSSEARLVLKNTCLIDSGYNSLTIVIIDKFSWDFQVYQREICAAISAYFGRAMGLHVQSVASYKAVDVRLSRKYRLMLDKLAKIHDTSSNNIIEALIQRESVVFGLIESRAGGAL